MRNVQFDSRWVVAIVVVAVLAASRSIAPLIMALVLGGSAIWLLVLGWRAWVRSGGPPTRGRVTYWRGQRYEVAPQRRVGVALPRWRDIGPAAPYLLFGIVLLLAAIAFALRSQGL